MAAIHDLPEAIRGDIPITDLYEEIMETKKIKEMNAREPICATLDKEFGLCLFKQINEYEENECFEAKIVRRLIKLKRFCSIVKTLWKLGFKRKKKWFSKINLC